MKTSEAIGQVIEYIVMSEMGGKIDPNDSWHSTFRALEDLQCKVEDEEADGHWGELK